MKTAIITGGAGGLGQALAARLQRENWHTVLLDLPGPGLEALGSHEKQSIYACDLTDGGAVEQVAEQVLAERPSIDLVVYNAGITHIGLFADMDLSAHRKVLDVNYFGAVHTARAFLKAVRASKGCHLAISSVAGFSPLVKRTAYAASKHALEGFFSSLRSEEKSYGVHTLIAAPSFVATNVGRAEKQENGLVRPGSSTDGVDYMSAERAAEIIYKAYERKTRMKPVGRVASLAWWLNRVSPRAYQKLMERNIKEPS
ncbi:oxidoreductase, short chain dehydrogenase/reductase family protein [Pseudovibrio sp. FO-BEG1]|uniref:SDR family NAD(P)-dependent oxidoreductase n=1 Tax=Pseudovibrio sp. (strain FO-BEG1) TaxID=911045 RepID=UPI000238D55F|nr:SDR family NAD(P)-dependent oxidoreductase [Pseudovibrio sp. FO-BEG1]AEV38163.1 oxidoreductase, short chain dehydrogenase/reductase family protein [Pseudovibrio sp. FO-BEG1]